MSKTLLRIIQLGSWLLFALSAGAIMTAAGVYLYLSPNLPDVDDLYEVKLQIPLRIYTIDGQLIREFGEKRRTPVKYDQVPQQFVQALLAAEDSNFQTHKGVAISGLLRATTELITTGHIQTGGSTITMQVARNFFLSREQTFIRKFNEILLALKIERKLSKEQIFELYVNKIFWGNRAYGVEAAANVYYGKSIDELALAQHAMIAGLPKAPSSFNPIVNPTRAKTRRDWILQRMLTLGYIEPDLYEEAVNAPITAKLHGAKIAVDAPYVAEMARAEILKRYGREGYDNGYVVYTTIDAKSQQAANNAIRAGILDYEQRHGYRGPESQSFVPDNEELNRQNWADILSAERTINRLVPAIVTAVHEKSVDILLPDDKTGSISFENGLEQARAFVSENVLGPEIKSASQVCQIGDLIRVYQTNFEELNQQEASAQENISALDTSDAGRSKTFAENTANKVEPIWYFSQLPKAQASIISLDPNNGAIRSMVGGFNFGSSKFNRAIQGERQPGSNFKPFIYAAALNEGFTPASLFNDAPVVMADAELENTWRPENASGKFYGPTRLRKALYLSRNLVSVRLLRTITPAAAIRYAENFGFDPNKLPKDLSLSLGSHAVTPIEVATGYAVFANGGYKIEPHIINKIDTNEGQTIFESNAPIANCKECEKQEHEETASNENLNENLTEELSRSPEGSPSSDNTSVVNPIAAPRVIDERVAYIIDSILKDVIKRGTGTKALALERSDIAGKTGTTNGPIDAWFSGYNSDLVASVWLGFDQNQPLGVREYGGSAALPIWIDYMRSALSDSVETVRPTPEGIISIRIDPQTGLLAAPLQRDAIFEIFREENVPVERAQSIDSPFGESSSEETGTVDELF